MSERHFTRLAALYALPQAALSIPLIPVSVLLPSFFARDLGLGFVVTGAVLLAARLLDIVTDPVIGVLSDRTRTRFGRRKPYMAAGGVLAVGALVALGLPVSSAGAAYLFGWSFLLYLGWTMVAIPYQTLAAELSPEYHRRTRLTSYRELAGLAGILVAVSVPLAVAQLTGPPANPVFPIAVTTAVVGAVTFGLFLALVDEPPPAPGAGTRPAFTANPLAQDSPFRTNALFVRLVSAWFVNGFANGLPAALLPVYVESVLGLGETARYGFLFLYVVASIAGLPVWMRLSARMGKHRTWIAAMTIASVSFAPAVFLGEGDGIWFALVCFVTGGCLGADLALPPSMQADVADVDRLRSRTDRTAQLFGWWSLAAKLATALAIGLGFAIIGTTGDGDAPARTSVVLTYAGAPVVLKCWAITLMRGYRLSDSRTRAIQSRLERRARPADAGTGQ